MTHKEAGQITDYHEGVLASFGAQEIQAHPATCNNRHIYSTHSQQLNTALGKIQERSPFSAKGRAEHMTASRDERGRSLRSMLTRPREIAPVAVRIVILVTIIWVVKLWIHGAPPAQRYGGFIVDFSKQPALQHEPRSSTVPPAVIPRGQLDLALYPGLENQLGLYDVVLTRKGTTYDITSGTMTLENGKPVLRVKLDLSLAPAGHYLLGIRPAGSEWKYFKVTLQSAHLVGY